MKLLENTEKKKKINIKAIIAVAVCSAVILGIILADFIKSRTEYEDTAIAMGTVINIRLFGSNGEEISELIKADINDTEKALLSWREENSDVNRINSGAGSAVSVSKETASIIDSALDVSRNCGGVFDITIGNVTKLWDFGGENQKIPQEEEIESALEKVAYSTVKVTDTTVEIKDGQSLDLGAIGKGAACDRVSNLLSTTKIDNAVISVGGSLLLYGDRKFDIGIVNPNDDKASLGTLELADTCISTSGDYEKFFTDGGRKYHHILNATTGYPAEVNLSSVTVVCESGVLSDALSTACYILGYNDSLALLEQYNAEAIFVFRDKTIRVTDGLKTKFTLTDESFKVVR